MGVYESEKKIYYTRDYELFTKVPGNRVTDPKRITDMRKSIEVNGWLTNPIMVNENYQIIDGQTRYEALKSLDKPIEFVVQEGAGSKEIQALNINAKNWNTMDFIDFYAINNVGTYITLRQLCDEYIGKTKMLGLASLLVVFNIVDRTAPQALGSTVMSIIRAGNYRINAGTEEQSREILDWLETHHELLALCNSMRRPRLVMALAFAYHISTADKAQLERALERLEADGKRLPQENLNEYLDMLSDAYNKRLSGDKDRIYLRVEYDKWTINMRNKEA